ncbi:MAG: hypothetical protein GX590_06270 [Lentisphaerae bacterium]|nr:hypothetical protein [Lentisphaerota bacterium]
MFLLRYLAVGIIGTLAVHYGAPRFKPLLAPSNPAPDGTSVAATSPATRPFEPVQERGGVRVVAPDPITEPDQPPSAAYEPSSEAAVAAPPPAVATPAADKAAPVVVTTLGYTPSTSRIPASGSDTTHWGVTLQEAALFERDGKRSGITLPGGVLVEQTGAGTSSRGEVALCRVWRQGAWAGPWLIATADLIRFEGGRGEVDADELDLLLRYGALHARQEARRRELVRQTVDANPHAAPLRQLKQQYDAAAERAKGLTRQRDGAQGTQRMKLGDELRRLKEDEMRMRRQIEALTRQYEAWKQAHPVATADPARDPQVRELAAQIESLRRQLGHFGL